MIDSAALAETATRLIRENGRELLLRRAAGGGVYDPVTGENTPGGPDADTPFSGVPLNITQEYTEAVGAQNVTARDQLIYMEPSVIEPKMDDAVVIDSEVWQVMSVQKIAPQGTPILFILQVRP